MPQKSQTINNGWLTVVTLRINFNTNTFTPSFRDKLRTSTSSKPQCSCSSLRELNPIATVQNFIQGLLPSDTFTVRFLIASPAKIKQAKQLCTPRVHREFDTLKEFRFWILSLATLLSELCESDHTQGDGRYSTQWKFGLRPFKIGNVTTTAVCEDIQRMLNTPLNPSEKQEHGMGYVYILRSQIGASTMGELKIGFSKYHPEHRAHELARCLVRPEIISHTPLLPHAKRLESIIHKELQACRKVQSCPKCCMEHREWFTISHADAREVVTRWSTWILQRPYVDGKLTDEWREYLAKKDMGCLDENQSLANFWKTIIDAFLQDESEDTKSQRIGKYLNDCYWDVTFHQCGLTHLPKDFCDTLRDDVSLKYTGERIGLYDVRDEMDGAIEKLRDLQMKDDAGEGEYRMFDYDGRADKQIKDMFCACIPHMVQNHPERPLGTLYSPNTPLGRMFHPETKVRHLINPDQSPGPLLRSIRLPKLSSKDDTEDLLKLHESIKTLKTGVPSVSDPTQGATESPLGDATVLPVIALSDLKYLIPTVSNWVGMNPTNTGFQYLQEAYQEGRWFGAKPAFQLPKAYRRAGYKSLSAKDAKCGPSFRKEAKERAKDDNLASDPIESDLDPDWKHDRPSFQLARGPDFERFTWTAPMNDEFLQAVNQNVEEIRNGGRANAERKLAKAFRDVGVDACFDIPDYGDTSDSESSVSTESSSNGEEERFLHSGPSSASLPTIPAKRKEAPSSARDLISSKKAKSWLESL